MRKRILFSILLIPIIVYVTYAEFLKGLLFFLFILSLSFFASREMYGLFERIVPIGKKKASRLWAILPACFLITTFFINLFINALPRAILYIIVLTVIVLNGSSCIRYGFRAGQKFFLIFLFTYVYCGIFLLLLLMLKQEYRGFITIYFLFLIAWLDDTAAYFIGTFFGKTKGIIKQSPNKSLEGYIGAFVATIAAANAFKLIVGDSYLPSIVETNILGILIAITAPIGDLGESMLKRRAGVKDSSNFLPGLGGVLDIFDSILFSIPFYYILLRLFNIW